MFSWSCQLKIDWKSPIITWSSFIFCWFCFRYAPGPSVSPGQARARAVEFLWECRWRWAVMFILFFTDDLWFNAAVRPGQGTAGRPRSAQRGSSEAHFKCAAPRTQTHTHILWNRLQIVKLSIDQRHKLGEPDSINLFRTPQESAQPGPSPKCKCKIFFEHNHIIWCFAHEQHGWACLPGDWCHRWRRKAPAR